MTVDAKQQNKKISFRLKTDSKCPVCKAKHFKEELLSGSGRLIADNLTKELRRLYKPSIKWGTIYPLAYVIQVCPKCLYSAFPKDFEKLNPESAEIIKANTQKRLDMIKLLFGVINFDDDRNLVSGLASYILAVDCYQARKSDDAPTIKKAICSIRAAWLLDDLFKIAPHRPYDKARDFYYMQAAKYYSTTLDNMQTGREPVDSAAYLLGPDQDKNWAYDGIIYLNAFLNKKFLGELTSTPDERLKLLETSKRYLSKLYGSGRSSKSKPSVIVDMAKDLFDEMTVMINEFK